SQAYARELPESPHLLAVRVNSARPRGPFWMLARPGGNQYDSENMHLKDHIADDLNEIAPNNKLAVLNE
ncbi:22708_t:CDS:2, partial [Racocetra persica]